VRNVKYTDLIPYSLMFGNDGFVLAPLTGDEGRREVSLLRSLLPFETPVMCSDYPLLDMRFATALVLKKEDEASLSKFSEP
jgi:hypothetical protein